MTETKTARQLSRGRLLRGAAWAIGCVVALCISLLFATGALAQGVGRGTIPNAVTNLPAEYDQLFQRMFKNPTDLDVTFQFAETATEMGNYEAAISALERMLLFNPNLPRVRLELGALYFRLGSYDTARAYLLGARDSRNVPPEVKDKVDRFLAEIDRRLSSSRISGSIAIGGRYQSNANAGPGPDVEAGGFSATLDNRFVKRPDWNFFSTGSAQHTYDLGTQDHAQIETNGIYYYAKQRQIGTVDLAIAEINTGPRWNLMSGDNVLLNLRPYGIGNTAFLNHNLYFWTIGAGLQASKQITDAFAASGVFEYRFKRFDNATNILTATDLDSEVKSFALDLRYAIFDNGALGGGVSFAKEDARTEFNSNRQIELHFNYTHAITLPWSIPEGPLVIIPSLYRVYNTYDGPDPSIDPNENRVNREWRWSITGSLGLYKGFAATAQFLRSVVWSNIPNYKYNNTSVTLGLTYSF